MIDWGDGSRRVTRMSRTERKGAKNMKVKHGSSEEDAKI